MTLPTFSRPLRHMSLQVFCPPEEEAEGDSPHEGGSDPGPAALALPSGDRGDGWETRQPALWTCSEPTSLTMMSYWLQKAVRMGSWASCSLVENMAQLWGIHQDGSMGASGRRAPSWRPGPQPGQQHRRGLPLHRQAPGMLGWDAHWVATQPGPVSKATAMGWASRKQTTHVLVGA